MTGLLFGVDVPTSAAPGADPVAAARRAESLGYDFVSSSDHPSGTAPTYETWTMLSWIAAATSGIRVLTRVLGVPYRNPAMVAKMAETFDRLPVLIGWSADGTRVLVHETRGTLGRLSALPLDGGAPVDLDAGDRNCSVARLNSTRTMP